MAIHAQKTTFRSSAQFPDFLVTGPLFSGQILCYNEEVKAFINKANPFTGNGGGGGGDGTIDGAVNLGSGAELFKSVNGSDELEFRTLLGGQGISLVEGAEEIEISNDIITDAAISVPNSFTIEIDNDDTTLDTAIFEILTNSNPASVVFTPISNTFAALDIIAVTDPGGTDLGKFVSLTADFDALGYEVGMCIGVTGTTEQDGFFKIASIDTTTNTNDTITITIHFPDDTDNGAQPSTTIDGMFFEFTAADTIVMVGRDLVADGFVVGKGLDVIGSTDNDGSFTIATVSGDTITITGTFPGTIGCDVGAITVEVPVETHSTGWFVNELGEMTSNATTICGDLDIICDGDINIDTGSLFLDGVDITTLINSSSLIVSGNGLIVQTSTGVFESTEIEVGAGLSIVDGDGVAGNPTISVDSFDITLGGEVTGIGTVTDLGDVVITTTISDNGVVADSYNKVTVDSTGRVTSGLNQSIFGTNGINVVDGDGVSGSPTISANDFDITLSGDVSGTATVTGLTNTAITVSLASIGEAGTFNTVTVDTKGRVISGASLPGGSFQPADPALDDLSGGLTSPGYVVWDGANYIDRTVDGTTNEIEVTDSDGVSGNATIGLADNPIIPGIASMTVPKGFTADRPGSSVDGMMRYNLDVTETFEGFVDGSREPFAMGSTSGFLPLSGGTMTGSIDMDGFDILNPDTVDGRDIAADGLVLDDLNTGTGFKVQIAPGDFENREMVATAPLVVTDGDGVAGNPTFDFDMLTVTALEIGQIVDEIDDEVLIYDDSQAALRRVSPRQLNNRLAHRYFMAQF